MQIALVVHVASQRLEKLGFTSFSMSAIEASGDTGGHQNGDHQTLTGASKQMDKRVSTGLA